MAGNQVRKKAALAYTKEQGGRARQERDSVKDQDKCRGE
jgi:hypothetical protein